MRLEYRKAFCIGAGEKEACNLACCDLNN